MTRNKVSGETKGSIEQDKQGLSGKGRDGGKTVIGDDMIGCEREGGRMCESEAGSSKTKKIV